MDQWNDQDTNELVSSWARFLDNVIRDILDNKHNDKKDKSSEKVRADLYRDVNLLLVRATTIAGFDIFDFSRILHCAMKIVLAQLEGEAKEWRKDHGW